MTLIQHCARQVTAYRRQNEMFASLAQEMNPFLDAVGQMVGKLLSIESIPLPQANLSDGSAH